MEQVRLGDARGEAQAREELNAPALADLARLDDAGFRGLFAGSPIKRIGHARFLRNVLIAIGNSGDDRLLPLAEARLADAEPLVRGAAVWAVRRLDRAARESDWRWTFCRARGTPACGTNGLVELGF